MTHVERPLPVEGQGPRITELWAWTAIDPMTDVEGIVGVQARNGDKLPAVTSMRMLAEAYRPVIEATMRQMAEPRPTAQLRHFIAVEE